MVRAISIHLGASRGARGLRQCIRAFVTALIAAVIALLVAQPVAAEADVPSRTLPNYAYDHNHDSAALEHPTTKRSPTSEYNRGSARRLAAWAVNPR